MTSIKERFNEKFSGSKHYWYFARASTPDDILAFIAQELNALADEVEKMPRTRYHDKTDTDRQALGHNVGIINAATLIRSKSKELE